MNEGIVIILQSIAQTLAMIPLDELEQHVADCRKSLSDADTIGVMLDPTGWQRAQSSGSMEDARQQLHIVEHLLYARQGIEARELFVAAKLAHKQRREQELRE